jgi:hypothetical protein
MAFAEAPESGSAPVPQGEATLSGRGRATPTTSWRLS